MLQGNRQVADGWERACQLTQLTLSQLRKHYICCGGKSLLKQFLSVSSDREIKGETARELTRHIFEVVCSFGYIQRARKLFIPFQSLPSKQNELQRSQTHNLAKLGNSTGSPLELGLI